MAEGLDSEQIEGAGERLVGELGLVERDGHVHGVDEHIYRLERVVRSAREGIASCDPP